MGLRENDVSDEAEQTCAWLLHHPNYKRWLSQRQGLLWIKGHPGAGKSALMKYALRDTERQEKRLGSQELVIASFFFHGRSPSLIQKSALGLYRSLLHRILDRIPDLLCKLTSIFTEKNKVGKCGEKWDWHVGDLRSFLENNITSVLETHRYSMRIYVDALDEAGDQVARDLVKDFQRLTSKLSPGKARGTFNICFSCRHYPIVALQGGLNICVEEEGAHNQDIAKYVSGEFQRQLSDDRNTETLEKEIVMRANGIFQWVVLVVPRVLMRVGDGENLEDLAAASQYLNEIPTELGDLYHNILQSINANDRYHSLLLFQWTCFARYALSHEEIQDAIVVDADTFYTSLHECRGSKYHATTSKALNALVQSLSGGLIEIKRASDKSKSHVQFIHQSAYDYLLERGLQTLDSTQETNVVGRAHLRLSRCCIKYMSMIEISLPGKDLEREFPLVHYAASSWISHMVKVEEKRYTSDDLLLSFLPSLNAVFQQWILIILRIGASDRPFYEWDCYHCNKKTTPLHVASESNLLSLVELMLKQENTEPDFKDNNGETPLFQAAMRGHKKMVDLLLCKGAEPDSKNYIGQTPLSQAASHGHKEVVELLLRKGAELDFKDNDGQTPLLRAAVHGQMKVIELLLCKGAEPDSKNNDGQTPLSMAAASGHMELLLRKGAELDSKNNFGRTPLFWAAMRRYKKVVELLLRKGAELDSKDNRGQTPLFIATVWGQTEVIELLLCKGAEPDSKDNASRTPLLWAAMKGYKEVVELLLRKGAEPDLKNNRDWTPLSLAARGGHKEVIELLLSKGAEPDSKDNDGQTPLSQAAFRGHKEVVELLLQCTGVDPNSKNNNGETPLSQAAERGHKEVVELLLCKGAVPDSKDYDGETPLSLAAKYKHEEVRKLLETAISSRNHRQ